MTPRSHDKPRIALRAFLLVLISMAMMTLFGVDGASAAKFKIGAKTVAGTDNVLLKVKGARAALGVSLYVDGHLAQRDHSWPWRFGHKGKITVGHGRHRVSVSARLPRKRRVRRSVIVHTPNRAHDPAGRVASSPTPTTNSDRGGRSAGTAKFKPVETNPPIPRSPAPQPPAEESPTPPSPTEPLSSPDSPPSAGLVWNGGYDTGSLSQWDLVQQAAPGRISIVGSPTEPRDNVARFEVRPEDSIGDTSPRAEVGKYLGEQEGEERYYRWYTYFPESFPTNYPNSFITFTQWRAVDESEDYTSFMLWGERLELRREGTKWSTKLTKGVWHKFVYHVKWSPDPSVGFIELFYDGQLVLPKTNVRTMAGTVANPVENYVKQGLYKSEDIPTGVLYQDGFVSGTSYDAVNNAPS